MKKIILLMILLTSLTVMAGESNDVHIDVNKTGDNSGVMGRERTPIKIPIAVFYNSDTNIAEVWCEDDNIQAEIYVYDENGAIEVYSSYMNIAFQLTSNGSHYIKIIGDGWIAHGTF
ncbi:MAG: hypothetical protein K2G13_05080 [Muribaculaceae bacterium]|nr:hypothetical protein [Muribaculaceae bacterium]